MSNSKNGSRRRALVLTADQFEDMEVYFHVSRLQKEGWDVTFAARLFYSQWPMDLPAFMRDFMKVSNINKE
jgi:hypothetical protein